MSKPPFELRILGSTELIAPDSADPEAIVRQSKRLALLAYLAISSVEGYRRRDQITALLWPELDQASARTNLRKALHGIRESLGEDVFVMRGEDELRVDSEKLACDAVVLRQLLGDNRWSDALGLYRGELLEGFFPENVAQEFEEWLASQRKQIREWAALAAWNCSAAEEARGDRTAAAVMARRARDLDPDNEEGVRRLMELLDRRGDRGSALRVYADWQSRMIEEFGVEPAPETRKVARRIQAARKGESHETPPLDLPAISQELPIVIANGPQPRKSMARPWSFAAFTVVAIAVASAIFTKPTSKPTIALSNLRSTGGPMAADVATALAEGLLTRLAADSLAEVYAFGPSQPKNAGAAYTIEGAVQEANGKIHVTLRLLRSSDGMIIWPGSYDAPAGSAVAIGERVAATADTAIRARLRAIR